MKQAGQTAATEADLGAGADIKVSLVSKTAHGAGDVGCDFNWMFVGDFLMIFYTDVFGISMGAVAGLMSFSRFWDTVSDPIIGSLTDKAHPRWERYRPWPLMATPLTAVVLILTSQIRSGWNNTAKTVYMGIIYCILVLGYTCVDIPRGTLYEAVTQNIEERAQINIFRSVATMIVIGIINITAVPLIEMLDAGNDKRGYLLIAVIYEGIFASCHMSCFAKTREVVAIPRREKISLKEQPRAVSRNRPYILALTERMPFGFILYGRNTDVPYYFTYAEDSKVLPAVHSMCAIIPSIIGAACLPMLFHWVSNKGKAAPIFAFPTGVSMAGLGTFTAKESPTLFYGVSALTQFLFSGSNIAIYTITPDCMGYGGWKTGLRNDRFQYTFTSLGNKMGMALDTSLLAMVLGMCGYAAGGQQNSVVLAVIEHSSTTIPGMFRTIASIVLFFYRLNRKHYNKIMKEMYTGEV